MKREYELNPVLYQRGTRGYRTRLGTSGSGSREKQQVGVRPVWVPGVVALVRGNKRVHPGGAGAVVGVGRVLSTHPRGPQI